MARKSNIAREGKRKYEVRVRNRCKRCGRPRFYMRALDYAVFVSVKWHFGAKFPES